MPSERRHRPDRPARVLVALMLREMATRYGRSPLGWLWAVLEPAGFVALLALLFAAIAHTPPLGRSFALFYATGYIAFHMVIDIAGAAGRAVQVNRPLLAFPPVTPLDAVLARLVLQALTGVAVAGLILGLLIALGDGERAGIRLDPGPLIAAAGLAVLLGLGIGLVNAWAFALSKTWELAWGIISRPLFLVSCVFYTYAGLPAAAREVLWWNPVVHVVGLVRAGVYPVHDGTHLSPGYAAAMGLGLVLAGLIGLRVGAARVADA